MKSRAYVETLAGIKPLLLLLLINTKKIETWD